VALPSAWHLICLPPAISLPRGLEHGDHILRRHAGLHVVDRAEDEASPGSQVVYAAFDLVHDLLWGAEELVLDERPSTVCSTAAVGVVPAVKRTPPSRPHFGREQVGRWLRRPEAPARMHAHGAEPDPRITRHVSRITFHASRIMFHAPARRIKRRPVTSLQGTANSSQYIAFLLRRVVSLNS
jgi:hypothetical protein